MDYKILPVGDSALTIIFGNSIDPEISRIVRVARKYLTKKNIKGVNEYVQTYATLMVHYRPVAIGYDELAERIDLELSQMDLGSDSLKKKTIVIPVCYGGEFGPDLPFVAELLFGQLLAAHFHYAFPKSCVSQRQGGVSAVEELVDDFALRKSCQCAILPEDGSSIGSCS